MAATAEYDREERRHQQRLALNGGLYAAAHRSGLIADISSGGLAFHYIDRKRWPAAAGTLTIYFDAKDFTLAGIPYTVTSDQPLKHQKDPAVVVKRMGLSFEALSVEQKEQLNYLLDTLPDPLT